MDSSQVLLALSRVDEVYRAALALFYINDWSYKEIATILEVPIGTVKSRIARGIAQLKDILLPHDSTQKSGAPLEDSLSCGGQQPLLVGTRERGYSEWDFSSTHLGEQIDVL